MFSPSSNSLLKKALLTSRLHRLFGLPRAERRLLIEAAVCLAAIRIALLVLPFRRLLAILNSAARSLRARQSETDRVAWAIDVASRHVPFTDNCLVRALAAQALLKRRRRNADIRFGVARNASGEFEAHAWVESDGVPIIGKPSPDPFTPLTGTPA